MRSLKVAAAWQRCHKVNDILFCLLIQRPAFTMFWEIVAWNLNLRRGKCPLQSANFSKKSSCWNWLGVIIHIIIYLSLQYEKVKTFYRVARVRCLHRHRRQNGHCHLHHPEIFYLYFFSYHGFACNHLPVCRLLDEYQKLYSERKAKSITLSLRTTRFYSSIHKRLFVQ